MSDLELVLLARRGQRVGSRAPADDRRPAIVIDVRCLQEPGYAERGVGHHSRIVLEFIRERWASVELLALASPERPIPDNGLFDNLRVVYSASQATDMKPVVVVCLSPMTAPAGPLLPFLSEPGVRSVAVVYDFIPAERPAAYLATDAAIIRYFAQLSALALYEQFLPISQHVGDQVGARVGPGGSVVVTGVATSPTSYTASRSDSRTVFVPVGGDPRKNALAAIAGFAEAWEREPSLRLLVSGRLPESMSRELAQLCDDLHVPSEAWRHEGYLSSADLDELMATAACVVVPSLNEGYSIPVAACARCGDAGRGVRHPGASRVGRIGPATRGANGRCGVRPCNRPSSDRREAVEACAARSRSRASPTLRSVWLRAADDGIVDSCGRTPAPTRCGFADASSSKRNSRLLGLHAV